MSKSTKRNEIIKREKNPLNPSFYILVKFGSTVLAILSFLKQIFSMRFEEIKGYLVDNCLFHLYLLENFYVDLKFQFGMSSKSFYPYKKKELVFNRESLRI